MPYDQDWIRLQYEVAEENARQFMLDQASPKPDPVKSWVKRTFVPTYEEPPTSIPTAAIHGDDVGALSAAARMFPLYLWHVERSCSGVDYTVGVVVVAGSEELARSYFPLDYGLTEKQLKRDQLDVTMVGIALPGAKPGTYVCTDFFNAG